MTTHTISLDKMVWWVVSASFLREMQVAERANITAGRAMPIEEILSLIRGRPFVPFRIHVLDGRTFEVRHPELVMPGARSLLIGWSADPALPYFDPGRHEIVSLLAVSRLEPIPT